MICPLSGHAPTSHCEESYSLLPVLPVASYPAPPAIAHLLYVSTRLRPVPWEKGQQLAIYATHHHICTCAAQF